MQHLHDLELFDEQRVGKHRLAGGTDAHDEALPLLRAAFLPRRVEQDRLVAHPRAARIVEVFEPDTAGAGQPRFDPGAKIAGKVGKIAGFRRDDLVGHEALPNVLYIEKLFAF